MLLLNDSAPDFEFTLEDGKQFRLSSYKKKKNVVLIFYPKDFSPLCTVQASLFRDNYDSIRRYDCEIIGISPDTQHTHSSFSESCNIPYLLISDKGKTISRLYGVLRLGGYLPFLKRVTYVIDKEGIIRNVIHNEFNMNTHLEAVRSTLASLETTSQPVE